jgi:PAS domain S-box-containing protein
MDDDVVMGSGEPSVSSARAVAIFGSLLAVALATGLLCVVVNDHETRLAHARRQSMTLATGVERLLDFEFRSLERAMLGVAADGNHLLKTVPEQAPALLSEAVSGVVGRHDELESIVVVDGSGHAMTRGRDEPTLPHWIGRVGSKGSSVLHFGPIERAADGQWVLPLAVPMEADRWVLAQLRLSELQRVVSRLDTGPEGVVTILDSDGTILGRSQAPAISVGRPMKGFATWGHKPDGEYVSAIDGVSRVTATRRLDDYPIVLSAGLSTEETLKRWYALIAGSVALFVLYCLGLAYLLRIVSLAGRAQRTFVAEAEAGAERLRLAQRVGRTGTWEVSADGSVVHWSDQVGEIFGVQPGRSFAPIESFYTMVHADDRERLAGQFGKAWENREVFAAEYRVIRPDGGIRWIASHGAVVSTGTASARMTGSVVDVTERVQAQIKLAQAEHQFRLLFERNPLPFWVFDSNTLRFLEVNGAAIERYGYSRDEFLGMTLVDIRPAEFANRVRTEIVDARADGNPVKQWVHQKRDGTRFEVRIHSADIDFAGKQARLVLAEDVSERVASERELGFRATHDMATGLANLHTLIGRLDGLSSRPGEYSIVYVQLRGLDRIGNTFGLASGASVRRTVADRFARLAAECGEVASIPSETFVLAIIDSRKNTQAMAALVAAVTEPVQLNGFLHQLDAHIGLAVYPDDGDSAEQVIGNAALAAHSTDAVAGEVSHFKHTMAQQSSDRLRLAGRVRKAIDNGEFELHFQPILDTRDGRPVALEALVRWPQPDGECIAPAQFIPLCEETGLIVPLGKWVLDHAAKAHRRLTECGWGQLSIAVNVSAVQFLKSNIVDEMEAVIGRYGLRRGALHVELTESVVMDHPEWAMRTMRELLGKGISISLDDFGTGFSSLSYLRHLPIDALKIDRAFVADVDCDERSASICRAMIELGHSLGMTVIAEGIERPEQHEWLRRHGCDLVQGFLFGQPGKLGEVIDLLVVS